MKRKIKGDCILLHLELQLRASTTSEVGRHCPRQRPEHYLTCSVHLITAAQSPSHYHNSTIKVHRKKKEFSSQECCQGKQKAVCLEAAATQTSATYVLLLIVPTTCPWKIILVEYGNTLILTGYSKQFPSTIISGTLLNGL